MFFKYNGIKVFYKVKYGGEGTVVFLHGWGCSGEVFYSMAEKLTGHTQIFIDFPPFGKSGEPVDFNIFTYAHMVICLLSSVGVKRAVLITHSFGSRVGIVISGTNGELVEKLIIIGGAGMKPRRGLKYYLRILRAKIYKIFKIKRNFGSKDYKKLSENMKKIFRSVVNEHLEIFARAIEAETLLLYGQNDKATPLYMARRMKKLIKNSRLVVIKGVGHFCFLEGELSCCRVIDDFLKRGLES